MQANLRGECSRRRDLDGTFPDLCFTGKSLLRPSYQVWSNPRNLVLKAPDALQPRGGLARNPAVAARRVPETGLSLGRREGPKLHPILIPTLCPGPVFPRRTTPRTDRGLVESGSVRFPNLSSILLGQTPENEKYPPKGLPEHAEPDRAASPPEARQRRKVRGTGMLSARPLACDL